MASQLFDKLFNAACESEGPRLQRAVDLMHTLEIKSLPKADQVRKLLNDISTEILEDLADSVLAANSTFSIRCRLCGAPNCNKHTAYNNTHGSTLQIVKMFLL